MLDYVVNPYVDVQYLKAKMDGCASNSTTEQPQSRDLRTTWNRLPASVKLRFKGRRDWESSVHGLKRARGGIWTKER